MSQFENQIHYFRVTKMTKILYKENPRVSYIKAKSHNT